MIGFAPRAVIALAAILLLLAPALWNGFPLLFFDTGSYLARIYDHELAAGRSVVYGLMLAAGQWPNFWPVAIAQAALTVWIIALSLRAHGFGNRPLLLLGITAFLTAATSLAWIAGQLMPDVLAGLSVLALYLLLFRAQEIGRYERVALIALIVFAAASHNATLAVLMILLAAALCVRLIRSTEVARAGLKHGALALVLAAALLPAANFVIAGRLAWTPGGTAFVFSRLVQDRIVHRFLDDQCPDPRFKLCDHRTELPVTAEQYLWHPSPFLAIGGWNDENGEMAAIARATLVRYPGMHVLTAVRSTAQQLVSMRTGDGLVFHVWNTYGEIERLTPHAVPAAHSARQRLHQLRFEGLNMLHVPVALASIGALPLLLIAAFRRRQLADLKPLAATIGLALIANAAVCGVLSNPVDRYGARMVWIATFFALLALARLAAATDWGALAPAWTRLRGAEVEKPLTID
jgi:hypothetical protein